MAVRVAEVGAAIPALLVDLADPLAGGVAVIVTPPGLGSALALLD